MSRRHGSAHPMLEPLVYDLTPEKAGASLQGELLDIYTLLWNAAVATQMDGPALREQLLELRLLPREDIDDAEPELVLQARQQHCVDEGWQALLPSESLCPHSRQSSAREAFASELNRVIHAWGPGELDALGGRSHSAAQCAEWAESLPATERWRASVVKLSEPRLSLDRLIEEMARSGVGRPSTFASTLEAALVSGLIQNEDNSLEVGPLGQDILAAMARQPQVGALDAAYSADLEGSLKRVETSPAQAGSVLDEFCLRALGQHTKLAGWLDELLIEGESLSEALARSDAQLPAANSWDIATLPLGLAPEALTRCPQEAAALRQEVDQVFAQADHSGWKRLSARQRAVCRTWVVQMSTMGAEVFWLTRISRDIGWRCWIDLAPEEPPLRNEELSAAHQRLSTLSDDDRARLSQLAEQALVLV